MAKAPINDVACFEATLDRLEADMGGMKARANAWAVGYVATLMALPHVDEERTCVSAVLPTDIAAQQGASDLPDQPPRCRLQAAEAALAKHAVTEAALPIENPVGEKK